MQSSMAKQGHTQASWKLAGRICPGPAGGCLLCRQEGASTSGNDGHRERCSGMGLFTEQKTPSKRASRPPPPDPDWSEGSRAEQQMAQRLRGDLSTRCTSPECCLSLINMVPPRKVFLWPRVPLLVVARSRRHPVRNNVCDSIGRGTSALERLHAASSPGSSPPIQMDQTGLTGAARWCSTCREGLGS